MNINWTGHFIVDFGQAAILALSRANQMDQQSIEKACDLILRAISDRKELRDRSRFFLPNSVYNQSSCNESSWAIAVEEVKNRAVLSLSSGSHVCHVCGRSVPEAALALGKRNRLPFLEGDRNFYSGLRNGMHLCGICELAVLATVLCAPMINGGTALVPQIFDADILYNLADLSYQKTVAGAETVKVPQEIAMVRQLKEIVLLEEKLKLSEYRGPINLWASSSGNQKARLDLLIVPNRITWFVRKLIRTERQLGRDFLDKLLPHEARSLLEGNYFIRPGTYWYAARLYLLEVERMDNNLVNALTLTGIEIANRIIQSGDSDRWLKLAERYFADSDKPISLLLNIVRELAERGRIQVEWADRLLSYHQPSRIVRYLQVCVNDYLRCQLEGTQFDIDVPDHVEASEAVRLVERVANGISQVNNNLKKVCNELRKAILDKNIISLKQFYVKQCMRGALGWSEFVQLCPPDFAVDDSTKRENRKRAFSAAATLLVSLLSRLSEQERLELASRENDDDDDTTEEGGN